MINWRWQVSSQFVRTVCLFTVVLAGCRASLPTDSRTVKRAVRLSEDGARSFAEGDTDAAIASFRRAIHKAWSADDPALAGTNAYNLAAALFDRGRNGEALDWLTDARVEIARAGDSPGYTYLLESRIAQSEGRFDDARNLIELANCSSPPCAAPTESTCSCEACEDPTLACVPCVGKKRIEKKNAQQCQDDYAAQIYLARSRLAAESYELGLATDQLRRASALAQGVCSEQLRAEIHHAAALIDLAEADFLNAAAHFDREATHLRLAGAYRKIPEVLQASAAAYEEVERFDLASDRLCRSARCLFARGEHKESWTVLQRALAYPGLDSFPANTTRMKLTAQAIEAALAPAGEQRDEGVDEQPLTQPDGLELNDGMLP